MVQYFFFADVLFLGGRGVILDLVNYIFPQQTCFIIGGGGVVDRVILCSGKCGIFCSIYCKCKLVELNMGLAVFLIFNLHVIMSCDRF